MWQFEYRIAFCPALTCSSTTHSITWNSQIYMDDTSLLYWPGQTQGTADQISLNLPLTLAARTTKKELFINDFQSNSYTYSCHLG